jgi:prephenate dehydrogenase
MPASSRSGFTAIIGLGLIGGSIARELAARGVRVLAHDRDPRALREAMRAGVIAGTIDASFSGLDVCDTVIFATPVDVAIELLAQASPHLRSARLITDAGSTKSALIAAAQKLRLGKTFVGSHPLSGDHRKGFAFSRTGLFVDARVILTPSKTATPATIRRARAMWKSFGAHTDLMTAAAHDREMAVTSHVHHFVAAALAASLDASGVRHSQLGPGGRDTTRLAGSSPEMWGAIASQNGPRISAALRLFDRELQRVRRAVARGDRAAVESLFERTGSWSRHH